jgi:hypothetical protein
VLFEQYDLFLISGYPCRSTISLSQLLFTMIF